VKRGVYVVRNYVYFTQNNNNRGWNIGEKSALPFVIWTQYLVNIQLVVMQCRGFACTQLLSWETILLAYYLGVCYKIQVPFIRMALLKGLKTLSGIPRGKGICKVGSTILGRPKIYNYDNPVETELDLLFRKLRAWMFIPNKGHTYDRKRGRSCASN
jgi:hypothetical protein